MKNSVLWIIVAAVLVGYFYRDITGKPLSKTSSSNNSYINKALQRTAKEQNRKLPMVFKGGEWTRVSSGDMRLTHYYQLKSPHQSKSSLYSWTRKGTCADPYISKLIKKGVTIEYKYKNYNNTRLFDFTINSSNC